MHGPTNGIMPHHVWAGHHAWAKHLSLASSSCIVMGGPGNGIMTHGWAGHHLWAGQLCDADIIMNLHVWAGQ